ncbi:MAG: tripartite tricarboxylate transporter TctB family protein [Cereibacter changlensis]|uniref:Tripartite tricarboxylate transporter TctB family protein n=2 Tax=Cereibacter changlensis TaxID=402884 RepID=A0A2T4JPE7_9RHOB|nr:tripartite tricarboxylate transporter TctB family protein [Cereibacter changlensis]PTE19780.1 tripartite tricarboxylate transporter TctB family protein [Cereibacter changlensis JA139]PZX48464.1 tripartite tricarboxylate transporter TctB family protein [Cereibacter changlensis]
MRLKDVTVGGGMTAAGLVYLGMAGSLPERDGVDAATVPTILAVMMIALGVIELIGALRRPAVVGAGEGQAAGGTDMLTVGLTLALIAGFIALLRPLGFPIATSIYLFLQFLVLTPRGGRPPVLLYAGLALGAALLIFVTFRFGFDLLLPAGPLVAWLN